MIISKEDAEREAAEVIEEHQLYLEFQQRQARQQRKIKRYTEIKQILETYYEPLSAYDFHELIFRDPDACRVYLPPAPGKSNRRRTVRRAFDGWSDLEAQLLTAQEIYLPDASFFRDYYGGDTLKTLHSLTIDIDQIEPQRLRNLCYYIQNSSIKPTAILATGSGIHLKYVFENGVEVYGHRKQYLDTIKRALEKQYRSFGKIDALSLVQPHRMAGSRTKFGEVAQGYAVGPGKTVSIEDLAKLTGFPLPASWYRSSEKTSKTAAQKIERRPEVPCPEPGCTHTVQRLESRRKPGNYFWRCSNRSHPLYADDNGKPGPPLVFKRPGQAELFPEVESEAKAKKSGKSAALPDAHLRLYEYCRNRVYTSTPAGNRYLSMFGLVVTAYKCRRYVSKSRLIEDLEALVVHHNRLDPSDLLDELDIERALEGWSNKATLARAEDLERWFGWEFERKTKRNGRSQPEHLELARQARAASLACEKLEVVRNYLFANRRASKAEIVRETGLSRHTVIKYYDKAVELIAQGVCSTIESIAPPLYDSKKKSSWEGGAGESAEQARGRGSDFCSDGSPPAVASTPFGFPPLDSPAAREERRVPRRGGPFSTIPSQPEAQRRACSES